jgi:hypothetical protein
MRRNAMRKLDILFDPRLPLVTEILHLLPAFSAAENRANPDKQYRHQRMPFRSVDPRVFNDTQTTNQSLMIYSLHGKPPGFFLFIGKNPESFSTYLFAELRVKMRRPCSIRLPMFPRRMKFVIIFRSFYFSLRKQKLAKGPEGS